MVSRRRLIHVSGAVGLDEAGRGPLAGPVTAAAVHLPDEFDLTGIDDSKRLSASQRRQVSERIMRDCRCAIVSIDESVIDEINILEASMRAMERAFAELRTETQNCFVDGNRVPPGLRGVAEAVVGGDGKYACIAAASIIAKVARDDYMTQQAQVYPAYGFDRNLGYGTAEHLEALRKHGPCPLHRRTFAPVANLQPGLFEEAFV